MRQGSGTGCKRQLPAKLVHGSRTETACVRGERQAGAGARAWIEGIEGTDHEGEREAARDSYQARGCKGVEPTMKGNERLQETATRHVAAREWNRP
jgi:hypothetical protein